MKSFTRNQPNPADRRFEEMLKKEMNEHRHLICGHNKEMQDLRDNLNIALEKSKSISDRNEKELLEFRKEAVHLINVLYDKNRTNDYLISYQRKMIDDLNKAISSIQNEYVTNDNAERLKKEIDRKLHHITTESITCFQDYQRQVTNLIREVKNDLVKLKDQIKEKFCEIEHKSQQNFSLAHMDKEGVLKEIRVYQKDIFVIEKKIENIYTLIERINKRNTCHKQE